MFYHYTFPLSLCIFKMVYVSKKGIIWQIDKNTPYSPSLFLL